MIRALHGFSFGIVSVANSTVAIDVMPSSRRGEGIGYFGVSSNLAMAVGPTVSLYLLESSHNYDTIFGVSLLSCCIGFILVTTVRMPVKERQPKPASEHISFDRFFLVKGTSGAIAVSMLSFSYGMLSTYLAIYGKDEVGMESGTGVFFMLMAFGLILSRLISGQLLNKGYNPSHTIGYHYFVCRLHSFHFCEDAGYLFHVGRYLGYGLRICMPVVPDLLYQSGRA